MVRHPMAGINDQEMVDTCELCNALNNLDAVDRVLGEIAIGKLAPCVQGYF